MISVPRDDAKVLGDVILGVFKQMLKKGVVTLAQYGAIGRRMDRAIEMCVGQPVIHDGHSFVIMGSTGDKVYRVYLGIEGISQCQQADFTESEVVPCKDSPPEFIVKINGENVAIRTCKHVLAAWIQLLWIKDLSEKLQIISPLTNVQEEWLSGETDD